MADAFPELADLLLTELSRRATEHGWSVVANASHSDFGERNDLGIDPVLDALAERPATASGEVLPLFRRAFDLHPASLSLLVCGLDGDRPDQAYRAALWWAGLVRSRITPVRRSDLHLFLIAPAGTDKTPSWRGRRSRFESDERFCRKFVWLPSCDPSPQEIGGFLDRTFLAQPWGGESAEPRSLDPLERLIEDLGSKSLTADEARRWIARLGAMGDSGFQLMAEELVAMLNGKP